MQNMLSRIIARTDVKEIKYIIEYFSIKLSCIIDFKIKIVILHLILLELRYSIRINSIENYSRQYLLYEYNF